MIFTGFSPNTTYKDVITLTSFLMPWKISSIKNGIYQDKLEQELTTFFDAKKVVTLDTGRSALTQALLVGQVKEGDEVIVQAFTCVVVINAILSVGAVPVFVDIDDNYCTNVNSVKKAITTKTKAIIVQHTFGFVTDLKKLCELKNIFIIEDCAHSLGAHKQGVIAGTVGDVSILSFGTDKVISSVRGGALVINKQKALDVFETLTIKKRYRSTKDLLQHIVHIPIFWISKPLYSMYIGKIILYISKKLEIINKTVTHKEKKNLITYTPKRLENILCALAYKQFKSISIKNSNRNKQAKYYFDNLSKISSISMPNFDAEAIYLRFAIQVDKPQQLIRYAKKRHIILGDWYSSIIAPADSIQIQYNKKTCINAERATTTIVNLPTGEYITKKHQDKIIATLKSYDKS